MVLNPLPKKVSVNADKAPRPGCAREALSSGFTPEVGSISNVNAARKLSQNAH